MSDNRLGVKIVSVCSNELKSASGLAKDVDFVVLEDQSGRQINVYVAQFEALSLSRGLKGDVPDRPLTYETMLNCLKLANASVEEGYINDVRDETFYALARLRVGEQTHDVDMRPSDMLNLVIRSGCPLFVSENVFEVISKDKKTD